VAGRRQTYAALLRAVNLGSRNKVAMPALRSLVEGLGCDAVQTYLQSGNVVLKSERSPEELRAAIERALSEELGVQAAVVLRTKAQLGKLVAANPFADRADDPRQLHVIFLDKAPQPARARSLDGDKYAPDELRLVGRDAFALYPRGYGRTKLTTATIEKHFAVTATSRNWRTVTALAELAANLE
jgi:uncharacterized protein (DUF1697 family)